MEFASFVTESLSTSGQLEEVVGGFRHNISEQSDDNTASLEGEEYQSTTIFQQQAAAKLRTEGTLSSEMLK